jgi:putative DNA primase/helicase
VPAQAHPYLSAKGVAAHGLRVEGMGGSGAGLLLVPLRDAAGTLHSLQTIAPDGAKRFLPGGRVRGCYHGMGKPSGVLVAGKPCGVLVVAEGYATAASIHAATGLAVAAAFSASNLEPVAQALRRKYPALTLVLAADDDWRTAGNPGRAAAQQAALAVGGLLVVPHFPVQRDGATDFNDLHRLAGLGAVRACFAEVLEGLRHDD